MLQNPSPLPPSPPFNFCAMMQVAHLGYKKANVNLKKSVKLLCKEAIFYKGLDNVNIIIEKKIDLVIVLKFNEYADIKLNKKFSTRKLNKIFISY